MSQFIVGSVRHWGAAPARYEAPFPAERETHTVSECGLVSAEKSVGLQGGGALSRNACTA